MAEKAGDLPDRRAALGHFGRDGVANRVSRHLHDLDRLAAPFLDYTPSFGAPARVPMRASSRSGLMFLADGM
jgi:hypothetical protein